MKKTVKIVKCPECGKDVVVKYSEKDNLTGNKKVTCPLCQVRFILNIFAAGPSVVFS